MRTLLTLFGISLLPASVLAHHSRAEFDMGTLVEMEGELLEVTWRNPHISFAIGVANEQGEQERWRIEGWGSLYTLLRTGVEENQFHLGQTVRVAGFPSTRRDQVLQTTHMLLENGTEAVLKADAEPHWSGTSVVGGIARMALTEDQRALLEGAAEENLGIFRVWSPHGYGALDTTITHYPFTESAIASRESYDHYDNWNVRCEASGMPFLMVVPHPYSFEDRGDEILLHGEQWDFTRVIVMDRSADNSGDYRSMPRFGRSTGRWEGRTLIVETTDIDWTYFDIWGTAQSSAMTVTEEFTLSEDQSRLGYRMTMTDPATFTEPAMRETYWLALENHFDPYDCLVE